MRLIEDLRQAWRSLRGNPAFLVLSSGVLALGLAVTIGMYGVTYTMLEKTPSYPDADRLVGVRNTEPAKGFDGIDFAFIDFLEIKSTQKSFVEFVGLYTGTMTITGSGVPQRISGVFSSEGLLRMLKVNPILGRGFRPEDYVPGATSTVLLRHDLWRTQFGSDPAIVGRTIKMNGEPTTVIGVMPEGFEFIGKEEKAWTALRRDLSTEKRFDRNGIGVGIFGRLRDGVGLEEAAKEFESIGAELARKYPETNKGKVPWVATLSHNITGKDGVAIVQLLFYAVWAVLAIACANVASLIFVRANQRAYESSMRAALGASRGRLVALTLAESLIIAGLAALIGLALAWLGLDAMRRAMQTMFDGIPSWWNFEMNWRVVAMAVGAALISGLLAGIWPALRASRPDVMTVLRDGGRSGTGLRLSHFTSTMVVVEIALAVTLLCAAGVMTKALLVRVNSDLGVSNEGVMTGRVMLPENAYDLPAQAEFWPRLVRKLQDIPGVRTAYATNQLPGTDGFQVGIAVDGVRYADRTRYPAAELVTVAPGFFDAVNRSVAIGRDFSLADRPDSLRVAIVNQSFADRLLSGNEVLGRRIRTNPEDPASEWLTIVGVTPNITFGRDLERPDVPMPVVYTSLAQLPERFVSIAVVATGDQRRFTESMRGAVAALDPELPMYFVATLKESQDERRAGLTIVASMAMLFAAVAIVLAAVGLYGVLAFTTSRRVREIGIRRALGAQGKQILRSVLRGALLQLGLGLGIGAVLAPIVIGALPLFTTGGRPHDPWIYSLVFAMVASCALLASWMPALRALRIQPAVALRYE